MSLEKVLEHRKLYADTIRAYVKANKHYWEQIPKLCEKVQGKNGYSEVYEYAIDTGLYCIRLREPTSIQHGLLVDCYTGNLVRKSSNGIRLLYDEEVIDIYLNNIDVEKLIIMLKNDNR